MQELENMGTNLEEGLFRLFGGHPMRGAPISRREDHQEEMQMESPPKRESREKSFNDNDIYDI